MNQRSFALRIQSVLCQCLSFRDSILQQGEVESGEIQGGELGKQIHLLDNEDLTVLFGKKTGFKQRDNIARKHHLQNFK